MRELDLRENKFRWVCSSRLSHQPAVRPQHKLKVACYHRALMLIIFEISTCDSIARPTEHSCSRLEALWNHLHRRFLQKWYLEIVISHIQINRRWVNFSSKWSLIHTNDAPWKYFDFWPPVFYICTFSGLVLSFAPPIFAKVIFRNSHYSHTNKSPVGKF